MKILTSVSIYLNNYVNKLLAVYSALHNTVLFINRPIKTESAIFVSVLYYLLTKDPWMFLLFDITVA